MERKGDAAWPIRSRLELGWQEEKRLTTDERVALVSSSPWELELQM